jgi:hypothetical protein
VLNATLTPRTFAEKPEAPVMAPLAIAPRQPWQPPSDPKRQQQQPAGPSVLTVRTG